MAPTYPLTAPTLPYPDSMTFDLQYITGANVSIFTRQEHRSRFLGEQWVFDVTLPPMERAEAEEWIAFHSRLRGSYGTFLFGPKGLDYEPRGVGTGTPLIDGGSQTGYEIDTKGWTPDTTGILLKGDWVQFGTGADSTLRKLELDANSDGSGLATLTLSQQLFISPADNDPLVISDPVGVFRMAASTVTWSLTEGMQYGYNFQALEIIQA